MARGPLYGIAAALHAQTAVRQLHRWLMPDAVSVVAYHGLVDARLPVLDPCFLPLDRFERQMEYLARNFAVLHLEEAFSPDRPPAARPVACVTFDDGLASVHQLALPVLERLRIPATVFLVTDLVDTDDRLWWVRLHRAVCGTAAAEVRIGDQVLPLATTRDRQAASASIQRSLKALAAPRAAQALDDVLDRLGAPRQDDAAAWAPMRALNAGEIRRMGREGLVRFGAHTASHQILTRTTPDEARREIRRSVAAVASLVERPSRTFAYPNGRPEDFDDEAIAELGRIGVEYALTTVEGPNPRPVDRYRVRRYTIGAADHAARFPFQVHHARALAEALPSRMATRLRLAGTRRDPPRAGRSRRR